MNTLTLTLCFLVCTQIFACWAEQQGYHTNPIVKDAHGKRIIAGQEADWHKYPWLAKNVCLYNGSTEWVVCGCSSTMISRHWAVTAGHCVLGQYDYKIGLMFSDGDVIEIGKQARPAEWSYDSQGLKYIIGVVSESTADVGLQRLVRGILPCSGKGILGVLFYSNHQLNANYTSTKGTLLGWGATEQSQVFIPAPSPDRFSASLEETADVILSNEYCQGILDAISYQTTQKPSPFRFTDSLLCASPPGVVFNPYPDANVGGLCKGDSGGPLFKTSGWLFPSTNIMGFVTDSLSLSFERPCGNGVDIYTRLTPAYLNWIRSIVLLDLADD